ncbi:MAG: hypothetical protein ACKPKO_12150 [Candidatus Fonsibacter sp.]
MLNKRKSSYSEEKTLIQTTRHISFYAEYIYYVGDIRENSSQGRQPGMHYPKGQVPGLKGRPEHRLSNVQGDIAEHVKSCL